jgi:hypothetical protein
VGKTTSLVGMLLVHLEIIGTTYHSMTIKTDVFTMYLSDYVSMELAI